MARMNAAEREQARKREEAQRRQERKEREPSVIESLKVGARKLVEKVTPKASPGTYGNGKNGKNGGAMEGEGGYGAAGDAYRKRRIEKETD